MVWLNIKEMKKTEKYLNWDSVCLRRGRLNSCMKEELDTMGKSKLIKIAALLLVMTLAILALIPEQDADNKLSGKEKTQQILMEDVGK